MRYALECFADLFLDTAAHEARIQRVVAIQVTAPPPMPKPATRLFGREPRTL